MSPICTWANSSNSRGASCGLVSAATWRAAPVRHPSLGQSGGAVGIGPVDRRSCTVAPRLDLPFSHQRNGPELVDGIKAPPPSPDHPVPFTPSHHASTGSSTLKNPLLAAAPETAWAADQKSRTRTRPPPRVGRLLRSLTAAVTIAAMIRVSRAVRPQPARRTAALQSRRRIPPLKPAVLGKRWWGPSLWSASGERSLAANNRTTGWRGSKCTLRCWTILIRPIAAKSSLVSRP